MGALVRLHYAPPKLAMNVIARATTSRHAYNTIPSPSPLLQSSPSCPCNPRRSLSSSATVYAKNHYDTLQLPRQATRQQIKAQFYRLSKEYHPDVKTGNETKFQAISEAYAILGHADSRRAYDSSMTASPSTGGHPGYMRHSGNTGSGYYAHQDVETASTRRARANYAWENTRRHNPRWAHPGRHNPFDHHHPNSNTNGSAYTYRTAEEQQQDHYERMQARAAWRATNMSSGARRRAMDEAAKMAKEEDLRNSSSFVRACQAVGMVLGLVWLTGSFKASAQERERDEEATAEGGQLVL